MTTSAFGHASIVRRRTRANPRVSARDAATTASPFARERRGSGEREKRSHCDHGGWLSPVRPVPAPRDPRGRYGRRHAGCRCGRGMDDALRTRSRSREVQRGHGEQCRRREQQVAKNTRVLAAMKHDARPTTARPLQVFIRPSSFLVTLICNEDKSGATRAELRTPHYLLLNQLNSPVTELARMLIWRMSAEHESGRKNMRITI
jgi:hypothetical protein